MIANIGMNTVRHIQWCGAALQIFHLTLWRKNEDLLLEDIALDSLDKLVRALWQFTLPVAQLLNPGDHLTVRASRFAASFEVPVAGDTEIRRALHVMCANLNLSQPVVQAKHCCMQRLVAVQLWRGDKIFDPSILGPPQCVDMSQRQVAVVVIIQHDAERDKIVNLADISPALLQFAVDTRQVLLPGLNLRVDTRPLHFLLQRATYFINIGLPFAPLLFYSPCKPGILIWFQVREGQVFQFRLHQRHTQAPGQRSVYLHGLTGLILLL